MRKHLSRGLKPWQWSWVSLGVMWLGIPGAAGEANERENAHRGSQNFEGVMWPEQSDHGDISET